MLKQKYFLADIFILSAEKQSIKSSWRKIVWLPCDGDVFIVMSRNRRIVRMFSFDNHSYSLFEKKFVAGYQFMKVERNGADTVYRIDWKDVVLILENPIVKTLKIR